ncbi:hypothetical protein GLOTRDRAFT_130879 [Gloeophyllum trabeum ATCC 11539]|uniref:DUF6533 domain-containing protein n=1 Tax=Gloeophyllum trabeum (strain ATCC 11539 / FP-39264 / Madison 617) TaxID=670483 RepID=S7Q0T2_GLOTA|nr:uncharacterized protein GLOTRDRAFT_130879 [Gloeophyllum trabeum ATCC 11539]EPQ53536.1 hypothetical protein GLOTRDRAFT_130879 [Gloeophyllum trabeum ATCC 11539]
MTKTSSSTHDISWPEFTTNCVHFASVALLFYDHALTLGSEVSFIWQSSARVGKTLFLLNRYFALASNMFSYIFILQLGVSLPEARCVGHSQQRLSTNTLDFISYSCTHFVKWREISVAISGLFVTSLMVLRIYALYNRSRAALASLCSAGIILILVAGWSTVSAHTENRVEAAEPCLVKIMGGRDMSLGTAWEALLAFDVFIFAMVVMKVLKEYHEEGIKGIAGATLMQCIIRDGAVYFVLMTSANLANIITYHSNNQSWVGFLASPASKYALLLYFTHTPPE